LKAIAAAHLRGAPEPVRARALALLCATLPRVGVLDEGVFACDLRGTARLLGDARAAGRRILSTCEQAGATCAVGVAQTPFTARIAAERAQSGVVHVVETDERAFLAPLPLSVLPLDPRVLDELALLGLRDVGAFAALETGAVTGRFGRAATAAHALACAQDPSSVHGTAPRRRIRAKRRWDEPVGAKEQLFFALRVPVDEIAGALAADGLAALRLVLRLEREAADGSAAPPLVLERVLLPPAQAAAALLRSLRWALDELPQHGFALPGSPMYGPDLGRVVGASLEATEVEPLRGRQLGLFAPDGARAEEALAVAQHLRGRLGPGAVLRARVVDDDARIPEREAEWTEVVA
jgi:protein ImuB